MPSVFTESPELMYVGVLFSLFVVPRVLLRFQIPTAITCLLIGALFGVGLGWFHGDNTIRFLSLLGIVSLFLFAGLEVDLDEMRTNRRIVLQHVFFFVIAVLCVGIGIKWAFNIDFRPSVIMSLALLTPSAGFILDSLPTMGLEGNEPFWVKSKAISTEVTALAILFLTLQSTTWSQFIFSIVVLGAMVFTLPLLFKVFAQKIAPYAPKSEFAFLLMMALLCAYITRKLGVYYLVGAFVVGLAARRYRFSLSSLASEEVLHAVEVFASFFIPFYFFGAGLELNKSEINFTALAIGGTFLLLLVPTRIAWVALHRKVVLNQSFASGMRVAMSLIPTLVFTLVLAEILYSRFSLAPEIYGGLILYTLFNTITPSFILHLPPPDFETPELDDIPVK